MRAWSSLAMAVSLPSSSESAERLRPEGGWYPCGPGQPEEQAGAGDRVCQDRWLQLHWCPWTPEELRNTADACKRFAEFLNETGARTRAAGVTLVYHNHDFEFKTIDGKYVLDLFYEHTDPNLVQIELDCFWVHKAGVNPAAYIRKYPNRVPLLHIKDMTAGPEPTFAEVGEGVIDWQPVFEAAPVGGPSGISWSRIAASARRSSRS